MLDNIMLSSFVHSGDPKPKSRIIKSGPFRISYQSGRVVSILWLMKMIETTPWMNHKNIYHSLNHCFIQQSLNVSLAFSAWMLEDLFLFQAGHVCFHLFNCCWSCMSLQLFLTLANMHWSCYHFLLLRGNFLFFVVLTCHQVDHWYIKEVRFLLRHCGNDLALKTMSLFWGNPLGLISSESVYRIYLLRQTFCAPPWEGRLCSC